MQTIADAAGVSRMTVSRALRNHPESSAEIRARIQKIAEDLGYRPNPLVAALMANLRAAREPSQGQTLAFITGFDQRDGWRRFPSVVRFFHGASGRAERQGFRLEHFWAFEPGQSGKRLSRILVARGIDGLIVAPRPRAHFELDLDWNRFAAATLEFTLEKPELHRASNDQFRTLLLTLEELKRRGYRRAGLVLLDREDEVNRLWRAAFLLHRDLHRRVVPPVFLHEYDESAFTRWFTKHRPDAVVGMSSDLPDWIRKLGLSVPDDVGFAHLNLQEDHIGRFAGVDQRHQLVGAVAVDLVTGQLYRNERGIPEVPRVLLLEGAWVDGPTLRPAPQAVTDNAKSVLRRSVQGD